MSGRKPLFRKLVLMPIDVPISNFCWDHITPCNWFSNEGGSPSCDLYLDHLNTNEQGKVPKPQKCLRFRTANSGDLAVVH